MTTADRFAAALDLHRQGRLDEAEPLYREAASAGYGESALNLAVLCLQTGRAKEALDWARQARAADGRSAPAQSTLATALHACGQPEQAVEAYDQALELDPGHVEAQYGLACALQALGRTDEALACYRRALVIDPDYIEAELGLANLLQSLRQYEDSITAYRRALEIDPEFHEPRLGLARALLVAGRPEEAETEYRTLLAACPGHGQGVAGLASVLVALDRHEEALALHAEALAREPHDPEAHRSHGLMLAKLGRVEAAAQSLERAIALAPRPAYFRELTTLRRMRRDDPHLAAMRAAAATLDRLAKPDQVQLHFALGRALSEAGEPEAAFRHLLAGNALHRTAIRYDEAGTLHLHDRIREQFTPRLLQQMAGAGHPSEVPIFLVGMPGSGTSLVEQMLVEHGLVCSAGASPAFGDAVAALAGEGGTLAYPELMERLAAADLRRLGRDYPARMRAPQRGAARILNTMLPNALFVGLIYLALPDARIIHIERDPTDTCLACFAEFFIPDLPYAYDLGELGRFYRAHTALMRHWQEGLPSRAMLSVRYEELVADARSQARRILDYCGLDWDERVVHHPIEDCVGGHWRPDVGALRPLLDGLAGR